MNDLENFRQINEIEKKIIIQSLSKISPNIFQFIIRSKKMLYISLKKGNSKTFYPSIYLTSKYFQKEIDKIEFNDKIYSVGLFLGFIKRGRFYISLEGTEFLYKKGILSDIKYIYVNKKGEKSILYGNDILKNWVTKTPLNLQKQDFLLIFNKLNEILAIAYSEVESKILQQLKPNDVVATTLNDKGFYLRKKQ